MQFYDSAAQRVRQFIPISEANIGMYVCGPTVYDRIHIGNARPLVFFDVVYRLLRHEYGNVVYVRNITDVDDKIIARAAELGISPAEWTEQTIKDFHADAAALNVLAPTHEPRATDNIDAMIRIIGVLLAKGYAYATEDGQVFMDASRSNSELAAGRKPGARADANKAKRFPADFALWKPATEPPYWDSPWGPGRPGWHIECSAMAHELLGAQFDIHGGGIDLQFPHHHNENLQSKCAFGENMACITGWCWRTARK